jgi:hypothetical protein
MKKMTEKKLALAKETLKSLQDKNLELVAGGMHDITKASACC